MRIKWNGTVEEVEYVYISDTGGHFKVCYRQEGKKHSFLLPKSTAGVPSGFFISIANQSLLENGFFNFDIDYANKGHCF